MPAENVSVPESLAESFQFLLTTVRRLQSDADQQSPLMITPHDHLSYPNGFSTAVVSTRSGLQPPTSAMANGQRFRPLPTNSGMF